ncbi:enoyl-CoA hydratase-related protein [Jatrophihabitans lederbergiae]|uniref:Enoyl-CoA hydratase-related protein n=1 Tax=Jatrophihabitans lederbergiae TaxID=3075547 RepID=A0ABU2J5X8_9ACTN|nr:enoyl-CoA hydratase-related protein [Jatrophihabitans sp. DSM 44399]MDT0260395.1 enoyl-CoA hydratase-related protein [Jatrophihabitans sp. DSM 44399]
MSTVRYDVTGPVATLTLDAPARRNAFSADLLAAFRRHLDTAESDPAVRTVVLSHTGPIFSSGMDLTMVTDVPAEDQPIVAFPALLQRVWEFAKPVIARVDGKARAGGIGLIAACDLAVAAEHADFAFTEVRLGLVPAVISVPLLPRLLPRAALELCLTAETFGAARAREIGLLNSVVSDVDAEVARYTGLLRLCEPNALAGTKAMLRRDRAGISMAADFAAMSALSARYFASPQGQEGIAAFAAKRAPSWAE